MILTRLAALALLLVAAAPAAAHPARGIVAAPDGRIYFSDLERIWSIEPNGRLKLVREHRGIHTHALAIARNGNLYGEDSEYRSADDSYRESIWRISRGGRFSYAYGPTSRLERGAGLQRDTRGCMYHADQTGPNGRPLVHRKCPGRAPERLVGTEADDRAFRPVLINDVAGTAVGADGSFYFRQGRAVRRVSPSGKVTLVGDRLEAGNFGIAVDPQGNVYVAEHSARRIVRIAPNGRRQIASIAQAPWSPTGVAVRGGVLFVLESTEYVRGVPTRMRVRRVAGDRSRTLATVSIPLG
jgi:hypothetical protein